MTNLKRIIDEKCVRQRWLAEQVGVTEVSMSRYVSGERIPKAPLAIRMADVLGVDVKELYGWDDKHVVGEPEQPEERTQERTETHACDYINRKDAIEAHYEYCNKHPDAGFPVWSLKILEDLPSAQPVDKDIDVSIKDCISRQLAIAEIARWIGYIDEDMINRIQIGLNRLPSAQPELIEKTAYIRGFEQGRTQGMIDSQGWRKAKNESD